MLKSVRLKNFKLHKDTTIEAAPITVFIGPNNSGKSSIFQALLALRQAAARASDVFLVTYQREETSPDQPFLFDPTEMIDLGEFRDVLRRGQDEILIGLSGGLGHSRQSGGESVPEVEFEVIIEDNKLTGHKGKMCVPGAGTLEWGANEPALLETDRGMIAFITVKDFRFFDPAGTSRSVPLKPAGLVESLHHISPLRGFEEWGYPLPLERAQSLVRLSLPDRAVALVTTIASNSELKRELSDRLSKLMGIGVDVEYVGSQKVKIFATETNGEHRQRLFANEGTGAQQLPFILIPVALTPRNETVLLSEPEAHLHPKGQCELTRMLLTVAKKENIQFFIETHSEHVLHVILNAVGRGDLAKDDVALHYFENVAGTAQVKRLDINEHGQVDGGLPGFFDQSLAELTEFLDAVKKK
jgi:energy-coupling factor transporter ATP-binding protein EcfA2